MSTSEPRPQALTPPEEREVKYTGTGRDYEEALYEDYSQDDMGMPAPKLIMSSSHQAFENPPTVRRGNHVISMQKYVNCTLGTIIPKIIDYKFKVNSDTYTIDGYGFPPNTLLITKYDWDLVWENEEYSYLLDVSLEYKFDNWDIRELDMGNQIIDESVSTSESINWLKMIDRFNNELTSFVPFNGSGKPLPEGAALTYLLFKGYPSRVFTDLIWPTC